MSDSLGISFAPTFSNAEQAKASPGVYAPQGTIQTLNFRLPKIEPAATTRAISPMVSDERRGSSISSAVLQSVFKTVLGADAASMLSYGSPAAAAMNTSAGPSAMASATSGSAAPAMVDRSGSGATSPFARDVDRSQALTSVFGTAGSRATSPRVESNPFSEAGALAGGAPPPSSPSVGISAGVPASALYDGSSPPPSMESRGWLTNPDYNPTANPITEPPHFRMDGPFSSDQQRLSAYRHYAGQQGIPVDQTDTVALNAPQFRSWLGGR